MLGDFLETNKTSERPNQSQPVHKKQLTTDVVPRLITDFVTLLWGR